MSLEQRVTQLEKLLANANEEIQRLKDRREDLDLVTEKAQQLEELLFREIDKNRCLANTVSDIDEEHARMFLVSERIKDKADDFALQYSSIGESMGYMLTSMRRHDDEFRNTNRTISKLETNLYEKIYSEKKEITKTMVDIEKRIEAKTYEMDTRVWFRIRDFENQIQSNKDPKMVEKIDSIVAEIERLKPKTEPIEQKHAKKWKKMEFVERPKAKYEEQFPNL